MRLLYIVTKGMDDPTLASVPLHLAANGSVDIGQQVSVVLAGDATELVIEDNMQRLEGLGVPPPENCSASSKNTRFLSTSERGGAGRESVEKERHQDLTEKPKPLDRKLQAGVCRRQHLRKLNEIGTTEDH
jgi:hypothetical protein